jgi:hypothetical protein
MVQVRPPQLAASDIPAIGLQVPRTICYFSQWRAGLGLDVPIREILAKEYGASFSPEEVATLTAAFEAALGNLGLVDRKDPATALVAQLVIRLANEGERDPKRLAEKVIGIVRGS